MKEKKSETTKGNQKEKEKKNKKNTHIEYIYVPHHGPPPHHNQPVHTSALSAMYESMPVSAEMHWELAPPAVSPRMARLPLALSHAVASRSRSCPIVPDTHASDVPDPSLSRYWCISYTSLSSPAGSLRLMRDAPLPEET